MAAEIKESEMSRNRWKEKNPTLQLRVERRLREAMKRRAREEGMSCACWVRYACRRELRRKPSL